MSKQLILQNVRVRWPDVFEATVPKGITGDNAKPAYRIVALIPKGSEQDKMVQNALAEVAREKWPKSWERDMKEILIDKRACCYIDGDRKEYDGFAGNMALSANRQEKKGMPTVVGPNPERRQLSAKDGKPYDGSYCNLILDIYASEGGGKGLRAELGAVQFYCDGDAFEGGARTVSEDAFADLPAPPATASAADLL